MSEAFQGSWRVREYVYRPDGGPVGTVYQRRKLAPGAERGLRVIQDCEPDRGLAGHPMDGFRGHHEFDLVPEGTARRYLGPDVVGAGVAFGDNAVLGRGVWPRFGYCFQSWSLMTGGDRQLTGGTFGRAGAPMAVIVGVAEPESATGSWPTLGGPAWPGTVADRWSGTVTRYAPDGEGADTTELHRDYNGVGFRERGAAPWSMQLEAADGAFLISGTFGSKMITGFARRYGWATHVEATTMDGRHTDGVEVLDAARGTLTGFRRSWDGPTLTRIEVIHLSSGDNAT